MKLHGVTRPAIEIRSADLVQSFQFDLGGLRLRGGTLLAARLRFVFRFPGQRRTPVTFTIQPPATCELAERKYADLIIGYLRLQGVMLK